jgi:hypothetical protein
MRIYRKVEMAQSRWLAFLALDIGVKKNICIDEKLGEMSETR